MMGEFAGGSQRSDYDQDPDNPKPHPPGQQSDDQDDASQARAGVQLPGGTTIQGTWDGGTDPEGTLYPDGRTGGGIRVTIPFGGAAGSPGEASAGGGGPAAPGVGYAPGYHPSGYCISESGDQYRDGEAATLGDGRRYYCAQGAWMPLPDPGDDQPGDNPDPADDRSSAGSYLAAADGSATADGAGTGSA